jgi:uncharacterized BrkB/YihY/UPF0761 family membrane protein
VTDTYAHRTYRCRSRQQRRRFGLATVWFVAFWVAGVRPSLAALLGAWSVYWSLSERPKVGLEWAVFGVILTAMFVLLSVETYL